MRGFTLIEILLVVALIGIVFSITPPLYTKIVSRSAMESNIDTLINVLRKAETNSLTSLHNSSWGVKIENNNFILFKGDSYINRDKNFDDIYKSYANFAVSNDNEIIFTKNSATTTPKTITLNDEERYMNIYINELGLIFN